MPVILSLSGAPGSPALHLGGGSTDPSATVSAIAPAPSAAVALNVAPFIAVSAVAQAPVASIRTANQRLLSGAAIAPAPSASLRAANQRTATLAAIAPAPTAAAYLAPANRAWCAATTAPPTAAAALSFDINLPQADPSQPRVSCWQPGTHATAALPHCSRDAERPAPVWSACHAEAAPARQGPAVCWETSERLSHSPPGCWEDAPPIRDATALCFENSPRITTVTADCAADADPLRSHIKGCFVNLDRAQGQAGDCWQDARLITRPLLDCMADDQPLRVPLISCWQHGRLPHTWIRPVPVEPPYYPPQEPVRLCLGGTPGSTDLHLGRAPCGPLDKRYYLMLSTAGLTLLDGTPLPATAVSVRTDADSWAWALSATLAGAEAYALVAPDPVTFAPKEVLAEINGWQWRFVLDEPRHTRQFGRTAVSLSGRSRSAFLTAPYWAATSGMNSAPITVAQAADQAVDSTGFSVDWSAMPDWTIPDGVLQWSGTPIERLAQLAAPTDGCLLSHRTSAQLSAYPRYPARPIHWDDLELDHSIPESAIVSLERSDDTRARYNAIWISGTTHGCLADCWITGTDASQRAPDIADALICDSEAIAARARALSVLGQSGPGWTLTAATLLQRPDATDAPRLVEPGAVVNLAGTRTLCRGVAVDARWSGDALGVRQTITLEQRAQEY